MGPRIRHPFVLASSFVLLFGVMQPLLLLGRGRVARHRSQQQSTRAYAAYYYGHQWLRPTGVQSVDPVRRPILVPFLCDQKTLAIGAGWGHSAFITSYGTALLTGRPHDFKNTMTHINAHALAPGLQRFVDGVSSRIFPKDMRPLELTAPSGDTFSALRCGPASLTALVTALGKLFVIGQNFHGQGGIGSLDPGTIYDPQPVQVGPASLCLRRARCFTCISRFTCRA